MRRFEKDGRWVEVSRQHYVFFEDKPCYERAGRGDIDLFLGDLKPLYVEHTPEGWIVGYRPNNDQFEKYTREMIAIDAWR